jgi:surface protein
MIKAIKYAPSGTFNKAWRKGNWLLLNSNFPGGPTSDTGFYNHIEPPEGGYTLYLNKESNGPAIYVFNNNTELFDFCNNSLGASQMDIIGTLDWIGTQDNYFVDPTYFSFNVDTNSAGVSEFNEFQLPLLSNGTINFVVDWGDGTQNTITSFNQAETLHTYSEGGNYTIKIAGILRGWSFNNGGDRQKFFNIITWGCFNLTNFGAFSGCRFLYIPEDQVGIQFLDVPRISGTVIATAFSGCESLMQNIGNPPVLGGWDVSGVQNFNAMFFGVRYGDFVNCDLEYWNTSSAIFMASTFNGCREFNTPISSWNTSNVTNMLGLFSGCYVFDQPIGNWNTSKVTSMQNMFLDASIFNQPIGNWNTGAVTNMQRMFQNAILFNQPIGNWNTGAVTNMSSMFQDENQFNQDIGGWNVSGVTNFSNFMDGKTPTYFSATNLDAIYNGWSSRPVKPNITISFGTIKYTSAGLAGRNILTGSPNFWTITDGGQE